ncbi:band 7 protein CG42540-like, partial [Musca vetustissima]|uniref:band 7 protein CG42540-like n=1 Tax=Musca vetustissima TaxID=27455 RepID=UPI002AB7E515
MNKDETYGVKDKCLRLTNAMICKMEMLDQLPEEDCITRLLKGGKTACRYVTSSESKVELLKDDTIFLDNFNNDDGRRETRRVTIHTVRTRASEEDVGDKSSTCGTLLIFLSVALVILTLPFSLFVCFKVVQEYERAVIFRLGRLMQGGAKGPGIFFILPCIDSYARVDLRTRTYDVPPQE